MGGICSIWPMLPKFLNSLLKNCRNRLHVVDAARGSTELGHGSTMQFQDLPLSFIVDTCLCHCRCSASALAMTKSDQKRELSSETLGGGAGDESQGTRRKISPPSLTTHGVPSRPQAILTAPPSTGSQLLLVTSHR